MRTCILGLSAALALMGCNKQEESPAGDTADIVVDQNEAAAETKLNQIGADLDRAAERAEQEVNQVSQDVKQAAKKGADKVERAAGAAHEELKKDKDKE